VQRDYKENFVRSMFDDFAKSTIEKVIEEVVDSLEDTENIVKIMSNIETRELLTEKMKEEESHAREMKLMDEWHINTTRLKRF
jgi:predicted DNA-binding protein YlxM (UPF0122 family)